MMYSCALPDDVLYLVFGNFDARDLMIAEHVSSQWRRISDYWWPKIEALSFPRQLPPRAKPRHTKYWAAFFQMIERTRENVKRVTVGDGDDDGGDLNGTIGCPSLPTGLPFLERLFNRAPLLHKLSLNVPFSTPQLLPLPMGVIRATALTSLRIDYTHCKTPLEQRALDLTTFVTLLAEPLSNLTELLLAGAALNTVLLGQQTPSRFAKSMRRLKIAKCNVSSLEDLARFIRKLKHLDSLTVFDLIEIDADEFPINHLPRGVKAINFRGNWPYVNTRYRRLRDIFVTPWTAVTQLSLNNLALRDNVVSRIPAAFPGLTALSLSSNSCTSLGEHCTKLNKLQRLNVSFSEALDIESLRRLSTIATLESLQLTASNHKHSPRISPEFLDFFVGHPALRELGIAFLTLEASATFLDCLIAFTEQFKGPQMLTINVRGLLRPDEMDSFAGTCSGPTYFVTLTDEYNEDPLISGLNRPFVPKDFEDFPTRENPLGRTDSAGGACVNRSPDYGTYPLVYTTRSQFVQGILVNGQRGNSQACNAADEFPRGAACRRDVGAEYRMVGKGPVAGMINGVRVEKRQITPEGVVAGPSHYLQSGSAGRVLPVGGTVDGIPVQSSGGDDKETVGRKRQMSTDFVASGAGLSFQGAGSSGQSADVDEGVAVKKLRVRLEAISAIAEKRSMGGDQRMSGVGVISDQGDVSEAVSDVADVNLRLRLERRLGKRQTTGARVSKQRVKEAGPSAHTCAECSGALLNDSVASDANQASERNECDSEGVDGNKGNASKRCKLDGDGGDDKSADNGGCSDLNADVGHEALSFLQRIIVQGTRGDGRIADDDDVSETVTSAGKM